MVLEVVGCALRCEKATMDKIVNILENDFEKILVRLSIPNGSRDFRNEADNDYLPSDPYPFFLIQQRVRDYSRLLDKKINIVGNLLERMNVFMDDIPTHPNFEDDPGKMPQDIDIDYKNFDPMCYDPLPLD